MTNPNEFDGVKYSPGQEPEKIKKRIDTLFAKLDEAYPDKVIVSLQKEHKKWGETVTQLYRLLGYPNGNAFLEAYGYTVKRGSSGRPAGKHMDTINELKRRYADGPVCSSVKELKEANPDLASKFKNLMNQSEKFFGMKFAKYLIKEGILVGEIESTDNGETAFEELKECCPKPFEGSLKELKQAYPEIKWNAINRYYKHSYPEKTFKDFLISSGILSNEGDSVEAKLSLVTEELIKRYPQEKKFQGSIEQLKSDNPDLPISSLSAWAKRVYQLSAKDYLIQQGIIEKDKISAEKEKLAEIVKTLKERSSSGEIIALTIYDLQKQNPDLDLSSIEHLVRAVHKRSAFTYLLNQGILREYSNENIIERDKLEAERQEKEIRAVEEKIKAEMEAPVSPLFYEPQVYQVDEIDIPKDEINDWVFQDDFKEHKGEIFLKDYIGNKKHIILPVSLDGKEIKSIGSFAFTKCKAEVVEIPGYYSFIPDVFKSNEYIKTVIIGEGVISISGYAFSEAENLDNVFISQSLEHVYESLKGAFYNTKWMNRTEHAIAGKVYLRYRGNGVVVNIPHGVTSVAPQVIYGCQNVRKVIIPDTVTTLCNNAFEECGKGKIREFVLPDSVTHIGKQAFGIDNPWINTFEDSYVIINRQLYQYKGNDTSVTIPDGVERIVDGVFSEESFSKSKIENVYLPDSIISIGAGAFYQCKKITKIDFPKRMKKLEEYSFRECENLVAINLPDSIVEIGKSAFERCKTAKTIRLGANLIAIGDNAFSGCKSCSCIDLPQSLESLGAEAFNNCRSLTTVAVPTGIERIERKTFAYCVSLQTIELSPLTSYIGVKAFQGCCSLKELTLPKLVTDIKESTFEDCKQLTRLRFCHTIELIDDKAFCNCSSLIEIKLAKRVGEEAFKCCSNLSAIEFNPEMTKIEDATFENCTSLTEIILPANIKSIGENAFKGCVNLKRVVLPLGLESIGNNAFYGCTSLEDIIVPNTVKKLGTDAFTHTPYLKNAFGEFAIVGEVMIKYLGDAKEVTIPSNVSIIGERAFSESWHVEKIIIPDTVKSIEARQMEPLTYSRNPQHLPQLRELIIGNGVTSIGEKAFAECDELRKVVFGSSLKTIGHSAFIGCNELINIDLSKTSVVEIGDAAFCGCINVQTLALPKTLQRIGRNAFYEIGRFNSLKPIQLPPSVQSIGHSSFFGTKELIVYDTIEPESEHGQATIGLALLDIPQNTIICVQNISWRFNFHITVISSETGKIKYRVFCDCKELYRYRAMLLCGWSKNAGFVLEDYDEYFMKSINPAGRTEMAFCRVQYPYLLSDEHRANYEAYLERCLYIERSAKRTAKIIATDDSVERLSILHGLNAIDNHNIGWLKEVFIQKKAKCCLDYLNKHFKDEVK